MDPGTSRFYRLAQLLAHAFDLDELRLFFQRYDDYQDILKIFPSGSLLVVAQRVVEIMERRGVFSDSEVFQRLGVERPRRAAEFHELAAEFARAAREPQSSKQGVSRAGALRPKLVTYTLLVVAGGLLGAAVYALFTRYSQPDAPILKEAPVLHDEVEDAEPTALPLPQSAPSRAMPESPAAPEAERPAQMRMKRSPKPEPELEPKMIRTERFMMPATTGPKPRAKDPRQLGVKRSAEGPSASSKKAALPLFEAVQVERMAAAPSRVADPWSPVAPHGGRHMLSSAGVTEALMGSSMALARCLDPKGKLREMQQFRLDRPVDVQFNVKRTGKDRFVLVPDEHNQQPFRGTVITCLADVLEGKEFTLPDGHAAPDDISAHTGNCDLVFGNCEWNTTVRLRRAKDIK